MIDYQKAEFQRKLRAALNGETVVTVEDRAWIEAVQNPVEEIVPLEPSFLEVFGIL